MFHWPPEPVFLKPYALFNPAVRQFHVLRRQSDGIVLLKIKETVFEEVPIPRELMESMLLLEIGRQEMKNLILVVLVGEESQRRNF